MKTHLDCTVVVNEKELEVVTNFNKRLYFHTQYICGTSLDVNNF